jgi:hypothetical protein
MGDKKKRARFQPKKCMGWSLPDILHRFKKSFAPSGIEPTRTLAKAARYVVRRFSKHSFGPNRSYLLGFGITAELNKYIVNNFALGTNCCARTVSVIYNYVLTPQSDDKNRTILPLDACLFDF